MALRSGGETLPRKRIWEMFTLNTHLYPGARLSHSQTSELEFKEGDVLTITFSDTIQTRAEVVGASENVARIKVAGYRTRKGATIAAKSWFIRKVVTAHGSAIYSVIGRAY